MVSSAEEDSQRSNGPSAHHHQGHDIPAAVDASSRPTGARSAARPARRSDSESADPPAATGTNPAAAGWQKPLDADVVAGTTVTAACDDLLRASVTVRRRGSHHPCFIDHGL